MTNNKLFDSLTMGDLEISNRIIMAPLTRCRADVNHVPTNLMVEYYSQRASAGLIISEATAVSPLGCGYATCPGIWNEEQIAGWKKITAAVHAKGGKIFLQLWHVGRVATSEVLGGETPVSASNLILDMNASLVRPPVKYSQPRSLAIEEIKTTIEDYRTAAKNAKEAGFDGVEVHAANGYLIDQFMQDSTNLRNDEYGGSIENRVRLLLEVVDAVADVWDSKRVGVHFSPACDIHDMGDSDPEALFSYATEQLSLRGIGFICTREGSDEDALWKKLSKKFDGVFIANQGLDLPTATQLVASGEADAIAFGTLSIANPDLFERFSAGKALNEPDPMTFYPSPDTPLEKGYTDYPRL